MEIHVLGNWHSERMALDQIQKWFEGFGLEMNREVALTSKDVNVLCKALKVVEDLATSLGVADRVVQKRPHGTVGAVSSVCSMSPWMKGACLATL